MRALILTDHRSHTEHNSLYGLAEALAEHAEISSLFIASRGDRRNRAFFDGSNVYTLFALPHSDQFQYPVLELFNYEAFEVGIEEFDVILLRIPRPIHQDFLVALDESYTDGLIINDIQGIIRTSNKSFLLELNQFTVPMKLCENWEDILAFKDQYSTVLKPLESYGGKGMIKIENNRVWVEQNEISIEGFMRQYHETPQPYLAMQYLQNVDQGDKRIVVVNGEILTSSLRFPPKGGWICNVAQGGVDVSTKPDDREREIVNYLNPILFDLGIFYYGLDTLVDDEGQRVISEINTLSVGGIVPGERVSGKPLSKMFAEHFVSYCLEE
jgi:glutathione synthase